MPLPLDQSTSGKDLKSRIAWLSLVFALGLVVLAVRLFRMQVAHHAEFAAKSVANFVREVRLRAPRGSITDARGEVLAQNRPSFDVFLTPAFCQDCTDHVLPELGRIFGWDAEQIHAFALQVQQARRLKPFQPVPVTIDIDRDALDVVLAHLNTLPGVQVEPVQHRSYTQAQVLSHVLGYMNEITQEELDRLNAKGEVYALGDYIGRRGIERYFEQTLKGIDGYRKEVVDAHGEIISDLNQALLGDEPEVKPKPGNNVVLSIDMRLQREAEAAFPGLGGAVVVVDPKTGFISSIVSRPGFDPNMLTGRITSSEMSKLSQDRMQPMIFRPTAQQYSPGSTFKMITSFAALRAGAISPQSTITCTGGYRLGARVWRCDRAQGHGPIALRVALQKSCDVFFYRLGDILGLDPIHDMGKAFGLGEPTGIGVVAEVPGVMPSIAYHNKVSRGGYTKGMALNAAIGQGDDNVTPLQLAMAYATLANGGTLYQPQLVKRIMAPDGQLVQEFEPKVRRKVPLDPEHRKAIIDALTAVVNEPGGTGFAARLPNITVAGKTGTAQVARIGAVRLKASQMEYWARDNAWFAALAPAEDPEVVVVVLNEHAGFGAEAAAPVAGRVLKKYFELKEQEQTEKQVQARPAVPTPRQLVERPAAGP